MSDPAQMLQAMLQPAQGSVLRFPPTSRYHGVATTTMEFPDGRVVVHLKRRLVPQPERFATLAEYLVTEGERLDHIAAKQLGDPELFWRLCDANGALRPAELEIVGRRVRIALPEGIPGAAEGASNA